jgi:amino acid transporter
MEEKRNHNKLSEWFATAICGNDIASSCLYVSVICTRFGGCFSPVLLLFISGILYLYKKIYAEVGEALPLNGGTYNCLLNTTSKYKASIAACLTILSYIATCVVSAATGMYYLSSLHGSYPSFPEINVILSTFILLFIFAILTIIGIGESAVVALIIFLFHILTLILFCTITGYYVIINPSIILNNIVIPKTGFTDVFIPLSDIFTNIMLHWKELFFALFFGFSSALLGISGFESSSNFIEEQKKGVFVKTLRNMWIVVSIFNPLIAFLALGTFEMSYIANPANEANLLADMAGKTGGYLIHTLVVIDAVLVLSGAVLTSYVGVTGLCKRMALDRCLPQFLLKENKRGTNHIIILTFFLLCSSILLITKGRVITLAGVYTISFLSVMAIFAVGNILLKIYRSGLKRNYIASYPAVIIAFIFVITGIIGNIMIDEQNVIVFLVYFIPTIILVTIMFLRLSIFRVILYILESITMKINEWTGKVKNNLLTQIEIINSHRVIFFTRGENSSSLNTAILYVLHNEPTNNIKVVHLYKNEEDIPAQLSHDLKFLNELYPQMDIEFVTIKGEFTPAFIEKLSEDFKVPKNYMFIGCPHERFPYNISEFGGVRLII